MQNVDSVAANITRIQFINKSSGTNNQESDTPLMLENLGNQLYANVSVTGHQLNESGNLDLILAANFSVNNITASTTGESKLIENSAVQHLGLSLLKGEAATPLMNETLYFYVDIKAGQIPGTYRENLNWTITISN